MRTLRLATRTSRLAQWQAHRVAQMLDGAGVASELVPVTTAGDRRDDVPIHAMGGTGVFVAEVQAAVRDGHADAAVHSAKDLPAATPAGLMLTCVPQRDDVRDVLVGVTLGELRAGDSVATGSVRRRVQLAAAVAGLEFAELRGNIETRLAKAPAYTAIVVANAALIRLGLADRATEVLDVDVMLPQVSQGALAVECRVDDQQAIEALTAIDDPAAHVAVRAERAFLAGLGGGCDQPLGALATLDDDRLHLDAFVADAAGAIHRRRRTGSIDTPEILGAQIAADLAWVVAPAAARVRGADPAPESEAP